jgi:hypothetical protein
MDAVNQQNADSLVDHSEVSIRYGTTKKCPQCDNQLTLTDESELDKNILVCIRRDHRGCGRRFDN